MLTMFSAVYLSVDNLHNYIHTEVRHFGIRVYGFDIPRQYMYSDGVNLKLSLDRFDESKNT